MPKTTTPKTLDLGAPLRAERLIANPERGAEIDAALAVLPEIQYHPLSGFGCADYLEDYAHLIESAGVFDSLKYSAAELRIGKDVVDIAGLAAIGSAFTQALSKAAGIDEGGKPNGKKLQALIVSHCIRFRVQANEGGKWIDLADADTIDAYLDFGQMLEVVFALAGGVLRPLWSRLRSPGGAIRSASPTHSTNATPAS